MVTMADVYIVLFTLIGILVSLPALLVALNLLLPRTAHSSYTRLKDTPWQSFFLGVPVASAFLLAVTILSQLPFAAAKALSFLLAFGGMGLGTVGAAGLARLLGERLPGASSPDSRLRLLLKGAVVYELACLVPIVGWFLFAPLAGIMLLGAATFAFIGWLPRPRIVMGQEAPLQVGAE